MPLKEFKDQIVTGVYSAKRALRERKLRRYRDDRNAPLVDRRILVAMDQGIGNAVEATPLVQAVRMLWPRAQITLIAPAGDLFEGWSVPDRVVHSWDEVSGEDVDATFLAWSCEAPEGLPGAIHRAQRAFSDHLLRPEREINMDLARALGFRGLTPPSYVSIRPPERLPAEAALRLSIAAGSKPGHRWRNKRWPHYARLTGALLKCYPAAQICLLGSAQDEFPGDLPRHERLLDLRGVLSLRETAWVLRRSDLAIGNDCGPMHIADAVLTPSLVLFGPTCEIKNGPRYRGVPINMDVDCSPCQYDVELLDSCDNPRCMSELSVELVMERAALML